jgi:DNA segregation ATPase FtsK/SpoIIIE, S-DNA-T family
MRPPEGAEAVASWKARIERAAASHREAAATAAAAGAALDATLPAAADPREQYELAEQLGTAAVALTPGWLGAPLNPAAADTPLGGTGLPGFVRIGTAQPLGEAGFPVVVPLLGTGHLALDTDARDLRVSGLIRALLVRLLAAAPAGSLLVRAVDAAGGGRTFAAFAPLADAGLLPPPASDHIGLRAALAEAEQWIRPAGSAGGRRQRRERCLLLVIASLPPPADAADLARIGALAQYGPAAGLHLIVAGWPPPAPSGEVTQPPLARSTAVSLRHPYALVGDPPGGRYSAPVAGPPATGLNAPVFLDEDPPPQLIERVCHGMTAVLDATSRLRLADLLPDGDERWRDDPADGLATTVGFAGDTPVTLWFNDLTPHWMVGGRSGAGKTGFLVNLLYGLCSRYAPSDLGLYLLDFTEGGSFAEFVPTPRDGSWLPHARAVGVESDREYGLAVLRELDAEMTRRSLAYKRAGATRFADLRRDNPLPRVVCVIDEFPVLLAGGDRLATEAVGRLESLARKGRSYGIHLVLASQTVVGIEALYARRDSIFGQFPVRVALPGGGDVLEPTNDSAAGLPLGTAVVNTAGGLGGPRGATRGHERMIQFPDPHQDRAALAHLRHRLWAARPRDAEPPRVFAGYAQQHLADDPTFQAAVAGRRGRPAALVGRVIDVPLSTAAFALDTSPGRHLAVIGSSDSGAEVLEAAARSLAAYHTPGTARFVISSLVADGDHPAKRLATDLAGAHQVETANAARLAAEFGTGQPAYLVVFGMDALGGALPTADPLRGLLREGPARGVHLLSWWRGVRRFTEIVGPDAREDVAGLVLLDVPANDATVLLGQPIEWRPRSNRALFYDHHADRGTVIVPFVRPERAA